MNKFEFIILEYAIPENQLTNNTFKNVSIKSLKNSTQLIQKCISPLKTSYLHLHCKKISKLKIIQKTKCFHLKLKFENDKKLRFIKKMATQI